MATSSKNSPGHESVVIDNDEGINTESNRTTTHIKSKVVISKNNECVLIEKGVKGSFVTVNRFKHFGFIKRKDKTEWSGIFAREASIIDQVRPKKFFVADTCRFDIMKNLKVNEPSDMMEIEEKSSSENYEIIDSNSRKILDQFLLVLDFNNTTETNQISSQAQIIDDLIEKSPFITINNKDQSVRLKSKTEYFVQAFDSVHARTCTTTDGNCLYSSLSIINIGSEKLTHSMRLLAVNVMINNSDYFQALCKVLQYSFEEQLKRTAMDTIWGGEVQIQALSMALSHPIYSYIQFNSDPKNRHYILSNISLQELVDRFIKGTAGGHLKYIGYKSDMNKLGLCIYYNGSHYDALLPIGDNPQEFVLHFYIINMSL
ncbi:unnamed protein product [Rotaria sp. Silwood2]|nr:unnamed protein product [Rotaria sp. Silwood2]